MIKSIPTLPRNKKPKSGAKYAVTSDDYRSHIEKNQVPYVNRVLIGVPLTGVVRAEWMLARYGQIIPTNWSNVDMIQWIDTFSPLSYMVADARNVVVKQAVENNFEWLLFIDHDTMLPPNAFLKMNDYMREGKYPVVCGLYYTRSYPAEPLIYRGRGNSFFNKWKLGDAVMVDGIPMGITLINVKLLKVMYENSEQYNVGPMVLRRVFDTPNKIWYDPNGSGSIHAMTGTEDLFWCDRIMKEGFLAKAGYPAFQKMKYPFLMDTSITCTHIDINGQQFPYQNFHLEGLKVDAARGDRPQKLIK